MKASFGKVCENSGQALGKFVNALDKLWESLSKHWPRCGKVCESIGQALGKLVKALDKLWESL